MRPVNKGQKPVEYKHYRDAEPYLEQRLGTYLNGITCYFPANTAIHVKAFM